MGDLQELISVPVITALVYGVMLLYKFTVCEKEKFIRLIPVMSALLGCILGVAIFYITPEMLPASNVFTAILVGGISGLASTGTHQMFKQFQSYEDVKREIEMKIKESCGRCNNNKDTKDTNESENDNDNDKLGQ